MTSLSSKKRRTSGAWPSKKWTAQDADVLAVATADREEVVLADLELGFDFFEVLVFEEEDVGFDEELVDRKLGEDARVDADRGDAAVLFGEFLLVDARAL